MICPFCGKEILANDGFCEYCDGYVGKTKEVPTKEKNVEIGSKDKPIECKTVETKKCKFCGELIDKKAFYCPTCHNIADIEQLDPRITESNSMRCLVILGFVLAFLYSLIGFILSVILLNFLPKESKTNSRKYCKWSIFVSFNIIIATIISIFVKGSFLGLTMSLLSAMSASFPGFICILCI